MANAYPIGYSQFSALEPQFQREAPKTSSAIREVWQELAEKIDKFAIVCAHRDGAWDEYYSKKATSNTPSGPKAPGATNTTKEFKPSLPAIGELVIEIESWFAYDRTQRKKDIAEFYIIAKDVLKDFTPNSERYMKDTLKLKVPNRFYETRDILETVTAKGLESPFLNRFDEVFNASGLWEALFIRPDTFFAVDEAAELVAGDVETYLVGDIQREWRRVQDEMERISIMIGNHTLSANYGGTTLEDIKKQDSDFKKGYERY